MSKTNDGGREVPGALPFELWSEWFRNNLGQAMFAAGICMFLIFAS